MIISEVLGGFFVSSKIVSHPDGAGQKFEDMV